MDMKGGWFVCLAIIIMINIYTSFYPAKQMEMIAANRLPPSVHSLLLGFF